MADLEHRTEDDDHAAMPGRTTPQGTSALAVDHGHEEEDVKIAPIIRWFGVLTGLILFSHVVSFGFYRVLQDIGKPDENRPLRTFSHRSIPPEPRLLPNVADSVRVVNVSDSAIHKFERLKGPGDYGQEELQRGQKALQALGFFDEVNGVGIVPDSAVAAQSTDSNTPMGTLPEERMPSDSTGGTGTENRLR